MLNLAGLPDYFAQCGRRQVVGGTIMSIDLAMLVLNARRKPACCKNGTRGTDRTWWLTRNQINVDLADNAFVIRPPGER